MKSDRVILQLMQTPGIGAKTLARLLTRLAAEGRLAQELLDMSHDDLSRHYGLKADMVAAFGAAREDASRLADQLEEHEVEILLVTMPQYPLELKKTLKDSAPPILFATGNINILQQNGVGISGARDASETGLKIASDCAQNLDSAASTSSVATRMEWT